ncbi:hypothetical protein AMELA_G00047600 [Ameiurus melas]|uniref:Uncharacterized protein n=1 Tax=Ameiurus melas TaxID=219545 RepID=A0A7J6B7K3_AMEME|nr:hypothetical protein AMELA_G00047600 [Ameiurus melas]
MSIVNKFVSCKRISQNEDQRAVCGRKASYYEAEKRGEKHSEALHKHWANTTIWNRVNLELKTSTNTVAKNWPGRGRERSR